MKRRAVIFLLIFFGSVSLAFGNGVVGGILSDKSFTPRGMTSYFRVIVQETGTSVESERDVLLYDCNTFDGNCILMWTYSGEFLTGFVPLQLVETGAGNVIMSRDASALAQAKELAEEKVRVAEEKLRTLEKDKEVVEEKLRTLGKDKSAVEEKIGVLEKNKKEMPPQTVWSKYEKAFIVGDAYFIRWPELAKVRIGVKQGTSGNIQSYCNGKAKLDSAGEAGERYYSCYPE